MLPILIRGAAALAVLAAIYAGLCTVRPFADCWRCSGRGWRRRLIGGQRYTCRGCLGRCERLRAGRRLYVYLRRTRAAAK